MSVYVDHQLLLYNNNHCAKNNQDYFDIIRPDNTVDIYKDNSHSESIEITNEQTKEPETCKFEEKKCDAKTCGFSDLHPILDPRFNMREVSKQCLLLEDHMNNKKKRCFDCIRKHFLIIDGLLEEAISLEKDNKMRDEYRNLYLEWVKIEKQYSQDSLNENNIDEISKTVRLFRKPLVEKYFDTVSEYNL